MLSRHDSRSIFCRIEATLALISEFYQDNLIANSSSKGVRNYPLHLLSHNLLFGLEVLINKLKGKYERIIFHWRPGDELPLCR